MWRLTIHSKNRRSSTSRGFQRCTLSNTNIPEIPPIGGCQIEPVWRQCCAARVLRSPLMRKKRSIYAGTLKGRRVVIEAVMFWNEPNNKSHWDFEIDPEWDIFSGMIKAAS